MISDYSFSHKIKILGVINRDPKKIEDPSTDTQIPVNYSKPIGFNSVVSGSEWDGLGIEPGSYQRL